MNSHSKTYEQYCCVKGKNIAIEEIIYHNGKKIYRCSMQSECDKCTNRILKNRFENFDSNEKND